MVYKATPWIKSLCTAPHCGCDLHMQSENHYCQCCVTLLKIMTFVGLEPTTSKQLEVWCAIQLLSNCAKRLYIGIQNFKKLWILGEMWHFASFLLHLTPIKRPLVVPPLQHRRPGYKHCFSIQWRKLKQCSAVHVFGFIKVVPFLR